MNNANAKSSINEASSKKEVERICCNFGKFTTDGKIVVMKPECARTYMEPMMELDKPVKSYSITFDAEGKIIKRVDSDGKELKLKRIGRRVNREDRSR